MSLTPLQSALTDAILAPLPDLGWIRVTGSDRIRWLNGMVTNSIQALQPGQGCYNFVLNAQGRIQADLTAFAFADRLLLQTERARVPAVLALLDRFIIMDDVELADASEASAGLLLAGPHASALLADINLTTKPPVAMEMAEVRWHDASVHLIHAYSPLIPRFELWAAPEIIADLTQALHHVPVADPDTLTQLRLLEGTPLYGTDIREKELAQETGQTRALHFSKGCYLGQEIVERIRSRGNVHRTLSGFVLEGTLPEPGAIVSADEKPVGELTSAAQVPLSSGQIQLALGYIRREALELHKPITYPGGTATPVTLPYQPASDYQVPTQERVSHV